MCGLAGILDSRGLDPRCTRERVGRMTDALRHRGPDDSGFWMDGEAGVAFGFRRLAILDLTPSGAQPMRSPSGRYVLVFNGEIYNYVELAEVLEGRGATFRGGSDTEVALAAFEEWGIRAAIEKFVGMFAIAVWDTESRSLTLARDRVGIKPLYYMLNSGTLLFASELKAIRWDSSFDATLDPVALLSFLRYLFIPAPRSPFLRARKLPPGHVLTIGDTLGQQPTPVPYWSLEQAAARGLADPLTVSDARAADLLEEALIQAIRIRLRSDVPLGVLLSGGVDSSLVAAVAQSQLDRPLRTFSIGFDSPEHDESHHARRVAEAIGTDHTELMVAGEGVVSQVPRLPQIFDEPLADPSQLPTLLVSELARREVTVALAGDGGDELFGGYNRYIGGSRWIGRFGAVPRWLRRSVGAGIGAVPTERWNALAGSLSGALPIPRLAGEKLGKLGRMMSADSALEMYRALLGAGWHDPESLIGDMLAVDADDPLRSHFGTLTTHDLRERMMVTDQAVYLPDDLLAKVDRTSMSVSLEVRVPLLDHRLVELSWRVPMHQKIRNGHGKRVLREVLHRHVPKELVDRPKVGFTPPIAEWLRGELFEWASETLDAPRPQEARVFDQEEVGRRWTEFLGGRSDYALGLWAILQWRSWADRYEPELG